MIAFTLIHYNIIYNSLIFNFKVSHGFTGLLVEPNPDFLEKLKLKGRNAWILPHCLSVKSKRNIFNGYFYIVCILYIFVLFHNQNILGKPLAGSR